MVDLSVVIVSLQDKENIECIPKLEEGGFDNYEIIVSRKEGISRARNFGIKEASSNRIVFIDDDALPHNNFLKEAYNSLEKHPIVAGRVFHPYDDVLSSVCKHYDQGDEPKYTTELVGCNMAFRKEVFEKKGYFDENISWGHDETELRDRLLEEYDIYYNPKMAVDHPYADSLLDYYKKMYRIGKADRYYERKKGYSRARSLLEIINPKKYLYYNLTGTIIRSSGGLVRSVGKLDVLFTDVFEHK